MLNASITQRVRSRSGSPSAIVFALALAVVTMPLGSTLTAASSVEGSSPPASPVSATEPASITITDHWGRSVTVPREPERVVIMEWEGLIAKAMRMFGVEDAIVGVDSSTKRQPYRTHIIPAIADAVDVGSAWSGVNYETLAGLRPDVVFLEAWVASDENRIMHQQVIDHIEAMGIPVVTLISPSNFENPDIRTAWEHVSIAGEVFGRQEQAEAIIARLDAGLDRVRSRTQDVPMEDRPGVAYFATANNVMGEDSIQSYLLTDIVNARNIAGPGTFVTIAEEQLLALDPDAMIVAGHDGYLDPELIYAGRHVGLNWANLAEMRAIKERRLTSLGYDEWRATIETPIALLKIAKLVYPERFADVDIEREELAFYADVYGMDEEAAREAIEAQEYLESLEVK